MGDMLQESAIAGHVIEGQLAFESWDEGGGSGKRPRLEEPLINKAAQDVSSMSFVHPGLGFDIEMDMDPVALGVCDEAWGRRMFNL